MRSKTTRDATKLVAGFSSWRFALVGSPVSSSQDTVSEVEMFHREVSVERVMRRARIREAIARRRIVDNNRVDDVEEQSRFGGNPCFNVLARASAVTIFLLLSQIKLDRQPGSRDRVVWLNVEVGAKNELDARVLCR